MRDSKSFMKTEYEDLVSKGFDWNIRTLESSSGPHATINGKDMIMLCSNNYLNLSNHPKLVESAISATQKYGAGNLVKDILGSIRPVEPLADCSGQQRNAAKNQYGTDDKQASEQKDLDRYGTPLRIGKLG